MYTAHILPCSLIDSLQIFDESWELVASPVSFDKSNHLWHRLIMFRLLRSWTSSLSSERSLTSFFLSNGKQRNYTREKSRYFGITTSKPGENYRTGQRKYAPQQNFPSFQILTRKPPQPCVCVDLMKLQKEESFSDNLAAYIGGSLLQAGSETTAGVLVGFIQAITIFPSVAKIAQEEIDYICGDRLPDLNDVPDLPYVRACTKETLRWMPGFLLGLPHAATRDDVYLGYRIPNKATILMNVWYVYIYP